MKTLKIKVNFTEEDLGTASSNPHIHEEYIASNAPDAQNLEQEVAAIGPEEVFEKQMTIFPKDKDGNPILWDYQWKGFFKDACGMLKKVPGSECSKIKAFKKEIDGLIFVEPRMIPINVNGEIGVCQRPLRANTPQGERVALASSETVPAGSSVIFNVVLMCDSDEKMIKETLEYGKRRGFGQWRNSGKGRFEYEILEEN